eukprot:gene12769-15096_t
MVPIVVPVHASAAAIHDSALADELTGFIDGVYLVDDLGYSDSDDYNDDNTRKSACRLA